MKTIAQVAAITIVAAAGLWLLWGPRSGPEQRRDGETAAPASAVLPPALDAGTSAVLAAAGRGVVAEQGQTPATLPTSDPSEWAAVETLLAQPHRRPMMREVPRLSPESEARLIARYRQISGLWNKQHIVRMLAFGGGSASAVLLRQTVTEEFMGKNVPPGDRILLEYIPQLCGVLARRNDDALQFLLEASRPGFWTGRTLWSSDIVQTSPGIMTGACIKGLGLCGRPEAQARLEWYRIHPKELAVEEVGGTFRLLDGALADAAFNMAMVRDLGIEAAMDDVLFYPEESLRWIEKWSQTLEGQEWLKVSAHVQGLAWPKDTVPSSPANP